MIGFAMSITGFILAAVSAMPATLMSAPESIPYAALNAV